MRWTARIIDVDAGKRVRLSARPGGDVPSFGIITSAHDTAEEAIAVARDRACEFAEQHRAQACAALESLEDDLDLAATVGPDLTDSM